MLYEGKVVNGSEHGVLDMYGYVSNSNNKVTGDMMLENNEEFEQLIAKYPEHEVYVFSGTDIDMALFIAPGVSAMIIETKDT